MKNTKKIMGVMLALALVATIFSCGFFDLGKQAIVYSRQGDKVLFNLNTENDIIAKVNDKLEMIKIYYKDPETGKEVDSTVTTLVIKKDGTEIEYYAKLGETTLCSYKTVFDQYSYLDMKVSHFDQKHWNDKAAEGDKINSGEAKAAIQIGYQWIVKDGKKYVKITMTPSVADTLIFFTMADTKKLSDKDFTKAIDSKKGTVAEKYAAKAYKFGDTLTDENLIYTYKTAYLYNFDKDLPLVRAVVWAPSKGISPIEQFQVTIADFNLTDEDKADGVDTIVNAPSHK